MSYQLVNTSQKWFKPFPTKLGICLALWLEGKHIKVKSSSLLWPTGACKEWKDSVSSLRGLQAAASDKGPASTLWAHIDQEML